MKLYQIEQHARNMRSMIEAIYANAGEDSITKAMKAGAECIELHLKDLEADIKKERDSNERIS
jgi:hypothetical protein